MPWELKACGMIQSCLSTSQGYQWWKAVDLQCRTGRACPQTAGSPELAGTVMWTFLSSPPGQLGHTLQGAPFSYYRRNVVRRRQVTGALDMSTGQPCWKQFWVRNYQHPHFSHEETKQIGITCAGHLYCDYTGIWNQISLSDFFNWPELSKSLP